MWDLASGAELETLMKTAGSEIFDSIAFTQSGKYFVSASRAKLRVWDTEMINLVAEFTGDNPFSCCAFALDEMTIIAGDVTGLVHFLRLEH